MTTINRQGNACSPTSIANCVKVGGSPASLSAIGGDANIFLSNGGSVYAPPTFVDALKVADNNIWIGKYFLGKNFSEPECLEDEKVVVDNNPVGYLWV